MVTPPAIPCRLGRGCAELRLYGVLRSSSKDNGAPFPSSAQPLNNHTVVLVERDETEDRFDVLTELLKVSVDDRGRNRGVPTRVKYRIAKQSDELKYAVNMDIKVVDDGTVMYLSASCIEGLPKLLIRPRYFAPF